MAPPVTPAEVRFWRYVDKDGPTPANPVLTGRCWMWTGAKTYFPNGWYSNFRGHNSRMTSGHRFSWEMAHGECTAQAVDHLCRTTLCVNPAHLEAVSDRINILRGVGVAAKNAAKTGCGKPGHGEYDRFWISGHRGCGTCKRDNAKRSRQNIMARRA